MPVQLDPQVTVERNLIDRLRSRSWEDRQHRKLREEAAAFIEQAKCVLQCFAIENPKYEWSGTTQDPCGVHDLLRRIS